MLLRILIVDDESYIADSTAMLLETALDRECEIQVLYDAGQALERMQKFKCDVLVTDIRMPGMDGIELMQRARALWPACEIILLTAYNEFDYAYKAIKQTHVDYVLKHEGVDAILSAVKRAIERMENANDRERILSEARARADTALPWLQREYILDLLSGKAQADAADEAILSLPVNLLGPMRMALIYVHEQTDMSLFDRERRLGEIRAVMQLCLPQDISMLLLPLADGRLLWLIQSPQQDDGRIESMLEAVQEGLYAQAGLSASFVYSESEVCGGELAAAYAGLDAAGSIRMLSGEHMWLAKAALSAAPLSQAISFWPDGGAHKETIRRLMLCRTSRNSEFMRMYMDAALPLMRLAESLELTAEQKCALDIDMLYDAYSHADPAAAGEYLLDMSERLSAITRSNTERQTDGIVKAVCDYIDANMAGDISLTALADCVHLNASYLSRLFKQRTGQRLNDYLRQQRLKRACELLRRPDIRVYEVGSMLGFATPAYFSYFFKREMGMTPKEYRERYGG